MRVLIDRAGDMGDDGMGYVWGMYGGLVVMVVEAVCGGGDGDGGGGGGEQKGRPSGHPTGPAVGVVVVSQSRGAWMMMDSSGRHFLNRQVRMEDLSCCSLANAVSPRGNDFSSQSDAKQAR